MSNEQRVLYTIRLEPSIIEKIQAQAAKEGVSHAVISRNVLNAAFGGAKAAEPKAAAPKAAAKPAAKKVAPKKPAAKVTKKAS